jgi:quinoprotein relay system zinc metallohydrolase 2
MRRADFLSASFVLLHATPAPITQIAPGLFVRPGATEDATAANADGIANTGFIIGDSAVAVIDPGGSLLDGQHLLAAIRAQTPLPIHYVIFTHGHPDHIFGAAAFTAEHPVFVGHKNLPNDIAARGEYYRKRLAALLGAQNAGTPIPPTRLVKTVDSIDLGHRTLTLRAWPTAHSEDDLTITDENTHTLWAGDLLFVGRIPALDGNLKTWIAALHELQAMPAARAVPGHGPASVPWPAAGNDEARYLATLLHDVRAAIARGEDIGRTVTTADQTERGNWALFDAYNGHNVTVAYKEVEWE